MADPGYLRSFRSVRFLGEIEFIGSSGSRDVKYVVTEKPFLCRQKIISYHQINKTVKNYKSLKLKAIKKNR